MLKRLRIQNYRCLRSIDVELGGVNVVFGPNGVGKSTFLDALWFLRDCNRRGVSAAGADRNHGVGLLWAGSGDSDTIGIEIEMESGIYGVRFAFENGRLGEFPGERLVRRWDDRRLIERAPGSPDADFHDESRGAMRSFPLREPGRLALEDYLYFSRDESAGRDADRVFRFAHRYESRYQSLFRLKKSGSESGPETWVWDRAENLISALRNLKERRRGDDRYETILSYMREAFPDFVDIEFEQTGPQSVYASVVDRRLPRPIYLSGVSDGTLQLLIHLTALFGEPADSYAWMLFDEPETSLHPWAIAVFAKAVRQTARDRGKQIFVATHSPVLLSQFDEDEILEATRDESGGTRLRRVSQIEELRDLIAEYALGSLYMSEAVAPQSRPFADAPTP